MNIESLKRIGFSGRGKTLHRQVNDVVQLVNFQKSNFSDEEYINVAFWPIALGKPGSMVEHKFHIRGRIEDFVSGGAAGTDPLESLAEALDGSFSSVEGIRAARLGGLLRNIYLSSEARSLITAEN